MTQTRKNILSILIILTMVFAIVGVMNIEPTYAATKKPAKVKGVSVKLLGNGDAKLSWKKTKNAKKYEIFVKSTYDTTWSCWSERKKTSTSMPAWNGAVSYYKVRAINGKKKGSFSATKKIDKSYMVIKGSKNHFLDYGKLTNSPLLDTKIIGGLTYYYYAYDNDKESDYNRSYSVFEPYYYTQILGYHNGAIYYMGPQSGIVGFGRQNDMLVVVVSETYPETLPSIFVQNPSAPIAPTPSSTYTATCQTTLPFVSTDDYGNSFRIEQASCRIRTDRAGVTMWIDYSGTYQSSNGGLYYAKCKICDSNGYVLSSKDLYVPSGNTGDHIKYSDWFYLPSASPNDSFTVIFYN